MNDTALTAAQKAARTRHERAEARKAAWRAEAEETRLIREAANAVLNDPDATHAEKIRAAEIITKIRGY